ncbi:MAG TPA: hypothetical protein VE133_18860 [Candidatus Sulfotelmatobacter sp.]|nr:hypothetical protein [Candidatus Sulfotelmatobacter sp.]
MVLGRPHRRMKPPGIAASGTIIRWIGGSGNVPGLLVFVCGHQPEQVAVGFSLQRFRPPAVFAQTDAGKDADAVSGVRAVLRLGAGIGLWTILDFQLVERGQGNAVSAIEMAQNFKDLGFELVVRALGLRYGAPGTPGFGLLGRKAAKRE